MWYLYARLKLLLTTFLASAFSSLCRDAWSLRVVCWARFAKWVLATGCSHFMSVWIHKLRVILSAALYVSKSTWSLLDTGQLQTDASVHAGFSNLHTKLNFFIGVWVRFLTSWVDGQFTLTTYSNIIHISSANIVWTSRLCLRIEWTPKLWIYGCEFLVSLLFTEFQFSRHLRY